MPALKVLLIEDSADDAELVLLEIRKAGFQTTHRRVDNGPALIQALKDETWDIAISDYMMPSFTALDAIEILKRERPDLPLIVVSGTIGEETAVAAMRSGARDYMVKGRLLRLAPALQRELEEAALRERHRKAEEALAHSEAQLHQAQKLEAVGRLAGGVAHDFNNVLAVIGIYAEQIHDNPGNAELIREYSDHILLAQQRAARLTRQLLTFSRRRVVTPQLTDLNDVVRDLEDMVRRLVGEDVEVSSTLSPALAKVNIDPGQVEQILMNLVVNARDAMPKGGSLEVRTDNINIDRRIVSGGLTLNPGPHVILSVKDSGCGMPEDVLGRIFEPFFTTKEIGKGTGLGLSTVYGIVKQAGGAITVTSETGKGSTFWIHLPIARLVSQEIDADKPAITPTRKNPEPGLSVGEAGRRVLLVEDEDDLKEVIRQSLLKAGYEVLTATDGIEALGLLDDKGSGVRLVITDVVMPKMNGAELAKLLSERYPDIRVLFLSGYTEDRIQETGFTQVSSAHFLEKPFTSKTLLAKLETILN